ncbi:MAG: class I SAM-dependent methyltransferase [Pirellulales bacterium]|nr:class I SAM-dependent methyltransferase [Pirellulales bacterium]
MVPRKQTIAHWLRRWHLLQFADRLAFLRAAWQSRRENKRFLAEHPGFTPPPARLAYDAYNHVNWRRYCDVGAANARLIAEAVKEHVSGNDLQICEWGCGPARVIRHLQRIEGFGKIDLVGADYNEQTIDWCEKNIDFVRFVKNGLEPPLPLGSDCFDCVYAISVFTHLSERMHYAWIEELFRILKPSGILLFTTHGDLAAKRLLPAEKERYDSGNLVARDRIREGKKHFAAYHPPRFVVERLLKDRAVLKHCDDAASYQLEQDVWIARK